MRLDSISLDPYDTFIALHVTRLHAMGAMFKVYGVDSLKTRAVDECMVEPGWRMHAAGVAVLITEDP